MLGLTKKSDYGLELMIFLGRNYKKGVVPLREVAKVKRLPLKFLEQIASELRWAGLVEAKEGKGGGYFLKKSPAKISVAKIVEVLETGSGESFCGGCPRSTLCGPKGFWQEIDAKIKKEIKGKKLADLVEDK